MKKLISGLLCLSSVLFADEFITPASDFQPESLVLEKETQKWKVLPYGHIEVIMPGVGVCLRAPKKKTQLEVNFKTASFPYIFVGPFINFYSTSFSILPSIYKTQYGEFYLGIGAGAFYLGGMMDDSGKGPIIGPMVPLFVGYEGKQIFVDVGGDLLFEPRSDFIPLPAPTLRMGLKF